MRGPLGLMLIAAVALLLRTTALSVLAERGLIIDVLAFVAVVYALKSGERWGSTLGFLLGLVADLDAAQSLGRHAMALAALGYIAGRVSRTLVRDSARTQFVLLFIATVLHQSWSVLFEMGGAPGVPYLIGRTLVSALATAAAGTVTLALLRYGSGQPVFGHAALQSGPPH